MQFYVHKKYLNIVLYQSLCFHLYIHHEENQKTSQMVSIILDIHYPRFSSDLMYSETHNEMYNNLSI